METTRYSASFNSAVSSASRHAPGFYESNREKTPGSAKRLLVGTNKRAPIGFRTLWSTAKQKATAFSGAVTKGTKKVVEAVSDAKTAALLAVKRKAKAVVTDFIKKLPEAEAMLAHSELKMPKSSTLLEMASMSYKLVDGSSPRLVVIGGKQYKIILKTATLTVFKYDDMLSRMVVVAVRGTKPSSKNDVAADLMIPSCKLHLSQRFKTDRSTLQDFKEASKEELKDFVWIGTGHSLGGAIIDELLKLKLIEQAVTFNPAVCSHFYHSQTNKRIYMSKDPLYLSMGRHTTNKVVIELSEAEDVGVMGAHFLINFNNRMSSSPVDNWWMGLEATAPP